MNSGMKILLLLPFGIDSQQAWASGYQAWSKHEIKIYTMSGSHWKWRMHGGAVSMAKKFMADKWKPDLILATDMMDLALFKALTQKRSHEIPTVLYFHQNQLSYPWSSRDPDKKSGRDRHYAWINYTSALVADRVFFSSHFQLEGFAGALPEFLRAFPDHQELDQAGKLLEVADVLPLGIDLSALDAAKPKAKALNEPPIVLWNHRWEYDKGPKDFFSLLYKLAEKGLDFRLVVMGKEFSSRPKIFDEAKERLASYILHWGYAKSKSTYIDWLWKADVLPVSSKQDFFGISVLEAIFTETYPLLPMNLAYPQHISPFDYPDHYYERKSELKLKLEKYLLKRPPFPQELRNHIEKYRWKNMAPLYDVKMERIVGKGKH